MNTDHRLDAAANAGVGIEQDADGLMMPSPRPPHILIADDSRPTRLMFARALASDFGATVCEAEDGVSALEFVDTHCFDLVLLDIMMPIMNGLEVLKAIRGSTRH